MYIISCILKAINIFHNINSDIFKAINELTLNLHKHSGNGTWRRQQICVQ